MKGTTVTVILLVGAVFLTSLPLTVDTVGAADGIEDAEAENTTYYCYGDKPELEYPRELPAGVTITWSAMALDDSTAVTCTPTTGMSTVLDLTGRTGIIRVTQTLTDGTTTKVGTYNVIPMHIGDAEYTVKFIDGTKVIDEETITKKTVRAEGENFFTIPSVAPTKNGYKFEGWYTSESVKADTLIKSPVTDNIDFYAKWSSSSGSGSSTTDVDIGDEILVTFNVVTGIEYNLLVAGDHMVTFTVNAVGGFDMKMDTLRVTDGKGDLIYPSGGNYIVTGIHEDTTITITCDRENPEPGPSEPHNGLEIPWWVFVPVGLVAFSLLMIGWYRK